MDEALTMVNIQVKVKHLGEHRPQLQDGQDNVIHVAEP